MTPGKRDAYFWRSIQIGDPAECWPWLRKITVTGYGQTKINGRSIGAHRVALAFVTERLPGASEFALHTCDNPICCNPHHLRWGTHTDNMRDRAARGRTRWHTKPRTGEGNPRAKLTWDIVAEIRRSGALARDLARTYGVSPATITDVKTGRRWSEPK